MNPNNEERVARMLREQRPELTPIEKDQLKLRAMRAARSRPRRAPMKRRLIAILTVAVVACSAGGAIAINGGIPTTSENAAVVQYGPGPQGPPGVNGNNGFNGQNGANGANGQNGAPGTTTTIVVGPRPSSHPSPKRKSVRVCKRFAHRSVKFHGHVFHPKTCWYRIS
jgi:hypothetical protein